MHEHIKNRLEQKIKNLDQLPSLPDSVGKVINMVNDPNVDFKKVALEISKDQSITTNILKLCNSAYFNHQSKEITSLERAIVTLGIKEVKDIIVVVTTKPLLNVPIIGYDLAKGELWKHNLAVAMLSKKIALLIKKKVLSDIVFTGGIIHDIGKTVLALFVANTFKEILALVTEKQIDFQEAEHEIMGFDHQEIGEKVLDKWNFPDVLKAIVRYHHIPEQAPQQDRMAVSIIHIANALCMMAGIGLGGDGLYHELSGEAIRTVGLNDEILEQLYSTIPELMKQVKSIF